MKLYHALPAIPAVALIGSGWFANRIEPRVFGLPFLLAWIVAWVLITSATMGLVYRLDHRRPGS